MKRSKRTRQPTTIGVIVAIIIAVIAALQSAQKTAVPEPTNVVITQSLLVTATAAPATQIPSATSAPISTLSLIQPPTLVPPTNLPGLEITPINGALYEVTGSVGGLGCPGSRCKEVAAYKKGNILVVTGSVMGTTYKTKKTRVWYQVISHDGSRIYVHASYAKPHEVGSR
jgi:hypothetical protein